MIVGEGGGKIFLRQHFLGHVLGESSSLSKLKVLASAQYTLVLPKEPGFQQAY
jgi:hypothetical protein